MEPKRNSSSQTTDKDFFFLQQTQEASTQTTEGDFVLLDALQNKNPQSAAAQFSVLDQAIYKEKTSAVISEISQQNMKRNESSDQTITYDRGAHKRLRLAIFGMREQVSAAAGEQGDINPDFRMCKRLSSNHTASDQNCFLGINPKFPNIAQLHSHIPGKQTFGCLYNAFSTIEGNDGSNMNFSLNENSPDSFSNSEKNNRKYTFSVNDIHAMPLGQQENNGTHYMEQTAVEAKTAPMCVACRKKPISNHGRVYKGKPFYRCCQCCYYSQYEDHLLNHILRHITKPFYCNVCDLNYCEKDSHDRDQTCDVCVKTFECKYQLEIHYLTHEQSHETNCILCKKEILMHYLVSNAVMKYKCCRCNDEYHDETRFQNHLFSHFSLKIYKCDICGYDFKLRIDLWEHVDESHPKCEICGKMIINSYSLEEHHLEEHNLILSKWV